MQSLTTSDESISSEKCILHENQNDAEFMYDGATAGEASLAARNSELAPQWDHIQKHVATICGFLPDYRFKISSGTESGLQEFCHRLLHSVPENVHSCERGIV